MIHWSNRGRGVRRAISRSDGSIRSISNAVRLCLLGIWQQPELTSGCDVYHSMLSKYSRRAVHLELLDSVPQLEDTKVGA